jgi:hypothetical protein
VDLCPLDAANDIDGDGICANVDPCPNDPNNDQDADGLCLGADPCPLDPNNDEDSDGLCANVDPCPLDAANDVDQDGICGNVDPCPVDPNNDQDADGICVPQDSCPADPNNDQDGDGVCGDVDNCPTIANSDQRDNNQNGIGDVCEDIDADGVLGANDNCPEDFNPGQEDVDNDGAGDVCDANNNPTASDLASCLVESLSLNGTDKLKAGKSKDEIGWRFFCLESGGTWVGGDDDNNVFRGTYVPKGKKGDKFTANYDGPSIARLGEVIAERLTGFAGQSVNFKKVPAMKIKVKSSKGKVQSKSKFQVGSQKGSQKVKLDFVP